MVRPMDSFFISDVSRELGMSFVTASKICNDLKARRLIISEGKGDSTTEGGKKPIRYKFNPKSGYVLCGHITGTNLECAISDMTGRLVAEVSVVLSPAETGKTLCGKMLKCYRSLLSNMSLAGRSIVSIAIGVNGIVDSVNHRIKISPHFPYMLNADIKLMVADMIAPEAALYLDNKIRFQVQYEADVGVARGKKDVAVLLASDGLVAGIMIGGKILSGINNLAGEIGHTTVSQDSRILCHCGGRGCAESSVTLQALSAALKQEKVEYINSAIEVFKSSAATDPKLAQVVDRIIGALAVSVSNLVMHIDPEIIVIQGIYADAGKAFYDKLTQRVKEMCITGMADKTINIVPSRFGDKVGLLSAAHYAITKYFDEEE